MKRVLTLLVVTACAAPQVAPEPPRVSAYPAPSAARGPGAPVPPTGTNETPAPAAPATAERPRGTSAIPAPPRLETIVSFPDAPRAKEPLLVAAHGAGDTPASLCAFWRSVAGARGVILCPGGPRMRFDTEGRYYPDHVALERIVHDAVTELRARHPEAVDFDGAIYTGYSQGATMGALMIDAHGAEFPVLALVEGGFDDWTAARAKRFHDGGGRRVLFACGRRGCFDGAGRSAALLRREGVETRVVGDPGAGHTYGGAVGYATKDAFEWLVGDDPRWHAEGANGAH